MSNFAYVLMAGTALLVLGGILAGITDAPGVQAPGVDDNESRGEVFSKSLGIIGTMDRSTRTIQLGDVDVTYQSPNRTVASRDSIEITNPAFSEGTSEVMTFETREPEALYISFTVASTNPKGDLGFSLNGHEERTMRPEAGKSYTVKLTNLSVGKNTLLIDAEGPGYSFWSSTRYGLRDVEVILEDNTASSVVETFRAYPYEIDTFDTGKLRFDVSEDVIATAPLEVSMNDNVVSTRTFHKRNLPYEIAFSSAGTGLHPGENIVSFTAEPGSEYHLSNVAVELGFYDTTDRTTVRETFNIPRLTYEAFRGGKDGRIMFHVAKVGVREPVTVTLNDREYTITPESGWNTLEFDRSDVSSGQNTVSMTTSGRYELSEFRAQIAHFRD